MVEIPPSEPMDGIELQQNAPLRDSQDIIGQEESVPSPPSVEEIPLGQGDSRHEDEQVSYWSEPSEQEVRNFAQELKQIASLLDTADAISGCSSRYQEAGRHLGYVGECMLHEWYQPTRGSVWLEVKVS